MVEAPNTHRHTTHRALHFPSTNQATNIAHLISPRSGHRQLATGLGPWNPANPPKNSLPILISPRSGRRCHCTHKTRLTRVPRFGVRDEPCPADEGGGRSSLRFSMRPDPRIRKAVKWGGAGATILLLAAWAVTMRWGMIWISPQWFGNSQLLLHAARGEMTLGLHDVYSERFQPFCTFFDTRPSVDTGWSGRIESNFDDRLTRISLWSTALIAGSASVLAWGLELFAARRLRLNLCPRCNYDLSTLSTTTPCPECGKPRQQ